MGESDDIFDGRELRSFWYWGTLVETCLTDDEAVAICGLIDDPSPQQYWTRGKALSVTGDMVKLAHFHAMKHVRQGGLRRSLDAAWELWERPIAPPPQPPMKRSAERVVPLPPSRQSSINVGSAAALFDLMTNTCEEPKARRILFQPGDRTFALIPFNDATESIQLFEGRRASQRGILGALKPSGEFLLTRREPLAKSVVAALRQFLMDPVGSAIAYGQESGECSFCGRALKDARSIQVGYGPICARDYGLSWGKAEPPG